MADDLDSWPPEKRPANFEFSPHVRGWAKWYRGQTRVVAVRSTDKELVRRAFRELCDRIDAKLDAPATPAVAGDRSDTTVLLAADRYFKFLDARVRTGLPEPMSQVTADDDRVTIAAAVATIGPGRRVRSLAQDDFTAVAVRYADNAPSTLYRVVAYVQAWMQFCVDEGLLDALPKYGRTFAKPSKATRQDARMGVRKAMAPADVAKLYAVARPDERCWIVLGLCGALDNADVAGLTWDVVDRDAGALDYRRRKRGKVRRVIPLPAAFWALLGQYDRPEPADTQHGNRVFLTPDGLPLQRRKVSRSGRPSTIDYVNMRWSRLMIAAGLRPPMPSRRRKADRDLPRRTKRKGVAGGQGFRSLRTTFPNLAPPGYRDEVEIVMGHAHGEVLLDHYLETVGVDRLKRLVNAVFNQLQRALRASGRGRRATADAPPAADAAGPAPAG